ncbi:PepSY domain-containing protein [Curtobacterium sp. Csp1]|uniref:PepSY domain-containing protein n=1 Tax=Curtobacterium citreum TaxID=2036 RepID=A0ABT2HKS3_9MICO|nr:MULTISPECIES: PepSY domain-containing protein [Curtobacterium]MCS6523878.1 PepSY domain-containing protein [Curtobacterium citreum]QKS13504.1 PepSY domain-containing protein [Curtobacterium sp. csp3]QKS20457.1 PepSY domain-containing protein [Curtobacterium sp. Csp1]TQJ28990.1 putative iron-regulated membrane protein [Curtobacterium citreum]GGL88700.1 membrane protein [Curtobacterium citreum]
MPSTAPPPSRGWFAQLLLRLHFLAGLFVGPFVLVAALSGAVYAVAPSIEQVVYRHELTAPSTAAARPLADQVAAAQRYVAANHPDDTVVEVRPAPAPGDTTRVMFTEAGLLESQTRAVFVDPGDASVRGDLPVYGTSGSLPFRTWISTVHRSLFLGDVGRLYSETAASWLGIVSLAGIGLWAFRLRTARRKRELVVPDTRLRGYRRTFSWHAATGAWVLLGALFLSATGITWSHFAGDNVTALRSALSWQAPTVDTALGGAAAMGMTAGEHAGHHGSAAAPVGSPATVTPEQFDEVLAVARSADVHAAEVRIRPAATTDQAWTVEEIKLSWPVAMNAVAVDPTSMTAVSQVTWDDYPLMAKAAKLGINTHMGALFGLPNQLVLLAAALGIAAMVVLGYVMWWQRRTPGTRVGRAPADGALARAPWWGAIAVVAVAIGLALLLPVVGVTLLGFLLVDALVTAFRSRPGATR